MFVTCKTLWQTLLNTRGMTTQAQKDAFCAIVNTCTGGPEVISGLAAPTAAPTNGEKIVVVQGVAGQPNKAYFWTGSTWIEMGGGVGASFNGITIGSGGNVTFTGNGTAGNGLVGTVAVQPVVLGSGGNVTFTGNGTTGNGLVANVTLPASACDQNKASPTGIIEQVFGQNSAGACVQETVIAAPTLCAELNALPNGSIATVVGQDASGNCVKGTVSGGTAPAAATDTVAGIAALNLGNNLPADVTNTTDALTAAGLVAIIGQSGGNALVSAICAALQTSGCAFPAAPTATSSLSMKCLDNGLPIFNPQLPRLHFSVSSPTAQLFSIEKYNGSAWGAILTSSTSVPGGSPAGTWAYSNGEVPAETLSQGVSAYYRVVTNGVAQQPQLLTGAACPADGG